jgi:chemotaxis protein MotB
MASDSIIIKKKKVVGHGGHHGGSWKVAYADFVTAMMAFFMVLWIMGLSQETQVAISGYFNDPAGFMKSNPRSRNVVQPIMGAAPARTSSMSKTIDQKEDYRGVRASDANAGVEVQSAIQKSVEGIPDLKKLLKHVQVKIGREGIRIELLEDKDSVFFESGSAVIRSEGLAIIKKLTPILANTKRTIAVEGHTDRKPYAGSIYTNWELSGQRAIAMRQALAKNGMPITRFRGVSGYADTRLLYPDKPLHHSNRRVTLLLPWQDIMAKPTPKKQVKPDEDIKVGPDPINLNADKNSH